MNNFDFESKKTSIILLIIFIGFALIIIKAFDYIPENADGNGNIRNVEINKVLETQNKQVSGENQQIQNEEILRSSDERREGLNVDLSADVMPAKEDEKPPIEEHLEPIAEVSEQTQAENSLSDIDMKFFSAQKLKDEKQYVKAIEEYKSILEQSSEPQVTAKCYEEMANIYGVVKRYGTALSYAQKAYNTYPTSSREMLLARLYYKTGDLDKATKRMNNVLQREFSDDRN